MTALPTKRLLLIPLWREIVATRIERDDFTVPTPVGTGTVHVGPEWPGDVLPFFPNLVGSLGDGPFCNYAAVMPGVNEAPGEVVGMLGTKGGVDEHGASRSATVSTRRSRAAGTPPRRSALSFARCSRTPTYAP